MTTNSNNNSNSYNNSAAEEGTINTSDVAQEEGFPQCYRLFERFSYCLKPSTQLKHIYSYGETEGLEIFHTLYKEKTLLLSNFSFIYY